jgi:hypothetical protein
MRQTRDRRALMRSTRRGVISAWFVVFGLFALSGSGMLSAGVLLLVVGGLGTLAIMWPLGWRSCHATAPARGSKRGPDSADEYDLMRMDSDQG